MKRTVALKLALILAFALGQGRLFGANPASEGDEVFAAPRRLKIEIPPEGVAVLQQYQQVWRQRRPEGVNVAATVYDGDLIYTNVAIHLKGSFSFQPFDSKPSLTLNFDKSAPGQRFHGLTKIHLNNSVQDPSYLCEQLARELFNSLDVPSPRAGHALVTLNGRNLGLFVLVEGANKQFIKRHFPNAKGNLYDGGAGGEVNSALKVECGEDPNDRSDLKRLVQAMKEPDPAKRVARLEQVLDVQRFINFAATEAFTVHWDGYCLGGNNYRVFHDVSRDKMVFIPHGLDQLFGVSSSLNLSITPPFKGLVAKALFSVPDARQRYLQRLEELASQELRVTRLHERIDQLAARLQPALADEPQLLRQFEQAVENLKARIVQRATSVAQQLKNPKRPLQFAGEKPIVLSGWKFKSSLTQPASSSRRIDQNGDLLSISSRPTEGSGGWRTTVLLETGHYEFTGRAHTDGLSASSLKATNGVMLRVSGERSTKGLTVSDDWKALRYEFDVRGIEDVELICEFRGRGTGFFDVQSLRLARKSAETTALPRAAASE